MAALPKTLYTPEEYLALERKAAFKSEYINGHIYAMAGATDQHNLITFNLAVTVGSQIRNRPCVAYVADMRVKINDNLYVYPDMAALCGERSIEGHPQDILLNPQVIIEVLSSSTEAYDRGDKFAYYRSVPSVTDYVLVSQDRVRVEHFVRSRDGWLLTEANDLEGIIRLESIDCDLPLSEVYAKVEFPPQVNGVIRPMG